MTNAASPMPEDVPQEDRARAGRALSVVWLVPIGAILIALGVAWQNWAERGPLIEVVFAQAAGVRANETELRYRDIAVGVVENLRFSDTLDRVVAEIRLDKEIAQYVDADARFWIVRPEVTTQGVSGLDTVLSGVYIAGAWDGEPGAAQSRFVGAEQAPLLALGERGMVFSLRSDTGLPAANTPILYRGVEVGRIGTTEVSQNGLEVVAEAVILEPYTDLVTSATRFWDISGFRFSLGSSGASLDFSSLASLISGGVTFETLSSGGAPITEGAQFVLYPDEDTAREDFFFEADGANVSLTMIFDQNLSGLVPGADVTLGGLKLGEVDTISGVVDPLRFGDNEVRLIATARINPNRIGIDAGSTEEAFLAYLSARINEGMRARLANASLLTGGLKIELEVIEGAAPAALDRDATPYPEMPTAPADVTDVEASAQGLIQRIDALPVEEVVDGIIETLADIRGIIGSDEVQAAPEALLATLEAIRAVAQSEEVAALPAQIGALADNLTEASASLNLIMAQVEDTAVVDAVADLIASLDATAQGLPALTDRLAAVLDKANALPLEAVAARAQSLLENADTVVADPDLTALPGDVRRMLEDLRAIIASDDVAALPAQIGALASGLTEASDKLNALLGQAQEDQILTAVSDLLASLGAAADRLPGIADQASAVLSEAEQLSLAELADQARRLLGSVDALVDQPGTRALPEEMNRALAALRATLEDLRQGGVVDNTNATLASARSAAEAIAEASSSLPALAERLSAVADRAGVTLADYGRGSDFGRSLSSALRQIEDAAASIDRLARQIQRNPNSLITGR